MAHQTLVVLDFGSQVTQLIARRIRELGVFAEILPTVDWRTLSIALGVAFVVLVNTLLTRTPWPVVLAANLVLVYIASLVLGPSTNFQLGPGLFFAFLLTLNITLYDRFSGTRGVAAVRASTT